MPRHGIIAKNKPKIFGLALLFYSTLVFSSWTKLAPGLDYQDLTDTYLTPWAHIHSFRLNLSQLEMGVTMAKDFQLNYASAQEYAQKSQALITINGGFFDESYQALGLRISEHEEKNPLKAISWWGIFFIKNNKAYLSSLKQFHPDKNISFAIQSGPRLLIKGKIPPLKPGRSERSALGTSKDGQIILLVTEHNPLSTTELAQIMKAPPLNCWNALNLDGGSSSQLYANIDDFHLDIHGFSKVSDAIFVKALKTN